MVTVLLGGTAVVSWGLTTPEGTQIRALYGLIGGTYLVSLAFALMLRQRRGLRLLAYTQITLDVAIAAVVVAITGRGESLFVFMFLLGIINAAVLRYRRGALLSASLAATAYLAVSFAGGSGPI